MAAQFGRLGAMALVFSLIVGVFSPLTPIAAFADTGAPGDAVVEGAPPAETPTPQETPTGDEPAPVAPEVEPTPAVEPTPDGEPTVEPTIEPTATPEPSAAVSETVSYSGRFMRLSGHGETDGTLAFAVQGSGLLRIDPSAIDPSTVGTGSLTLVLAVPESLELPTEPRARFSALATHGSTAPLVAVSASPVAASKRQASSLVTQTPNAAATHEVFAVLVSPNNQGTGPAVNQTAARVSAAVSFADDYWSEQSGGSVSFSLVTTVPWYKSSYRCDSAGSYALWDQAATKAISAGYDFAANQHLVLVLPYNASCGGGIGLGTIGWSVNDTGALWILGAAPNQSGSGYAIEKATLAHELGHNLSLGHANWLDCASSTPYPGVGGLSGCSMNEYGDIVDVMGFGISGASGGALSSPGAIRAGIWPDSAWTSAGQGTTTHTLNSVSSNEGLRAVVVQDSNNVNYFIEFRDFSDEDAQYANVNASYGCQNGVCTAGQPNVRILRLGRAPLDGVYYNALPGFDASVIGRTVGGVKKVGYVVGETFTSQSSGGISVEVTGMTSSTATVEIRRGGATAVATGSVRLETTSYYYWDAVSVGDTVTAFLSESWRADEYTYEWRRNGAVISGATGPNYTISPADYGAYVSVRVTGTTPGQTAPAAVSSSSLYVSEWGVYTGAGTISVGVQGGSLAAVTGSWPSGTTFTYQWYRASTPSATGTAIAGATASTYLPTPIDRNQFLRVRVRATLPGSYVTPTSRYSVSGDYTLNATGSIGIDGARAVGNILTVANGLTYSTPKLPDVTGETYAYQWLRAGVAIPGATGSNYVLTSSDLGKVISVRQTTSADGLAPHVATSIGTTAIASGTLTGPFTDPVVTKSSGTPFVLTGALAEGSIDQTGLTLAYQWLRVNRTTAAETAITGATKATYTPTAADYAFSLRVRITVTKAAYASRVLYSPTVDYSLRIVSAPAVSVSGPLSVGNHVSWTTPIFTAGGSNVSPTTSAIQWLRNGVAVSGATSTSRQLISTDLGTAQSYRLTASLAGYLPYTGMSPATAKVVAGTMGGTRALPTVTVSATNLATAVPTEDAATVSPAPAAALAYQWYRAGVAITGATKSTYQLATADYNRALTVRITYSKAGWTAVALTSLPTNHSVLASPAIPVVAGDQRVGGVLTAVEPSFTDGDGAVVAPTSTYQWYRSGIAIAGQVSAQYTLVAADKGKAISVRVTSRVPGLLPWVATSVATPAIGTDLLEVSGPPVVGLDSTTSAFSTTLRVTDTGISGPSGTVSTYQWLRNGVAITGATKVTYLLAAADAGKNISVRVTTTKKAVGVQTWTPVIGFSVAADYTVTGTTGPITGSGAYVVGTVLEPTVGTYAASIGDITGDVAQRWQWLRNGATISGATASSYTLAAADVGTKITVRVTTGLDVGGYLPLVQTQTWTPSTAVVGKGMLTGAYAPTVIAGTLAGQLAVAAPVMTPTPTFAYQWYRNGVAITGATKSTYALTTADAGRTLTVRVTASRAGYTTVTLPISSGYNPMMQPDGPVTINGTANLGLTLTAVAPDFSRVNPVELIGPTLKYQWLRNGVAITGATGASYTLTTADLGKRLTVRVTASAPGVLPVTTPVSAQTAVIGQGTTDTGALPGAVVTKHPTTGLLTASMAGPLTPATPAPTLTFQWTRTLIGSGTPVDIPGATKSTYAPTQADRGHYLNVKITTTRANFTNPVVALEPSNVPQDYALRIISGDLLLSEGPQVGRPVGVLQPTYGVQWMIESPPVTFAYQWFAGATAITGATKATYTPLATDLGKQLSVRVTASSPGWIPIITTSNVETVALGAFSPSATVVVTSSSTGLKATLSGVTETGYAVAYRWSRTPDGGTTGTVAGRTTNAYALSAADYNAELFVTLRLTKAGYAPLDVSSVGINWSVLAADPVTIAGDPRSGQTVSAALPTYSAQGSPTITFTYQWLRNGVPITGAAAATYKIVAADVGKTIAVRVTASSTGRVPLTLTSESVGAYAGS